MERSIRLFNGLLLVAALGLSAPAGASSDDENQVIGAVYTMSNDANANSVLVYDRNRIGTLQFAAEVPTGGLGSGAGLGNQNAVILDPAHRWLFVVNAGSNDISVFAVASGGLSLVEVEPSGGLRPVSLTIHDDLLYVLNAGGAVGDVDNITAFTVADDGSLSPLPGSTQPLSAASTGPAQVQFNADGNVLVVTEKGTNLIDTYTVGPDGLASAPTSFDSAGATPFGFAFSKRDILLVSEAAGGGADASSVSSYQVASDGTLTLIDGAVPTTETAACWVVVSNDGRFAYTTNAGSGSVSGYEVAFDGMLSLLRENGVSGRTGNGSGPIDMALSGDGHNLYTLNGGTDTLSVFRVLSDGKLARLRGVHGLPDRANGLAAR